MQSFTFHMPTRIVFGKKSLPRVGREMAADGVKRVLFVAGRGSIKENGVYDQLARSMEKHGVQWRECFHVQPNPLLSKAYECIRKAVDDGVDAVLAAGGGSVMDTGKAAAAGVHMDDVWDAFSGKAFVKRALPVYAVVTLSGSGSETSMNMVLTRDAGPEKFAAGSPALVPRAAFIDPRVQYGLPRELTVNGAADALSHVLEHYLMGRPGRSETSMCVCEGLMRSIISATDRLVEDPEDYEARADLAWSSALALSALTSVGLEGGDWSAHLLEHALSALWPEVPHGAGLAVLFPALLQREEAGTEYARTRFAREVMGAATALEGGVALREKFDEWGAPATLSGLGIPFDENDRIIRHVMRNMESVHAGGKGREAPDEKALAELLEDVR